MGKFNLAEHIQTARPPAARDIETITGEILDAKRAGGEAILTIGRGLIEAKALLSHGEWLPWLEERVEFSERAAQNFMRLARNYSNPQALADLGAAKALMLLALPPEQREEFIEATHLVDGEEKTVIDMTSREMERVIKERDEARMVAEQARAAQKAADEAREKMSADMALANQRLEGLNELVERYSAEARERQERLAQANARLEEQSARAEEAQAAAQRLAAELEELKARPVDVVVETDANALQAARKEAEAAMQAQLDEAKAAAEQARAELMEANSVAQRAKLEQEQARQELEQARAEAAALREQADGNKAALAADADLALFRALFEQAQELADKLGGVLMKFRDKNPKKAQGLANAVQALADKIREVAAQ